MAGDAKTYTFERIKELGLAPTFKKIPESLFAYSRPVYDEEAEHDMWWRTRMEGAYAKWAHAVKPLEILHWGDPAEIPSLVRKGASLLPPSWETQTSSGTSFTKSRLKPSPPL